MKYILTFDRLKIRLNDESFAVRDHLDDGLWFTVGKARLSYVDVGRMCGRSSDYIKGLVEAGRSYARLAKHDRAKIKQVNEYVSHNDTPLLAGIKKMLARKYGV